jgi:hypothetical protein
VSETPHNLHKLQLQAQGLQGLIRRRTNSPPSPTEQALRQLVKGCQIAMQSAVLVANENSQLRAANNKQKKKRNTKRSYIATGGSLTAARAAEAREQLERARNEQRGGVEVGLLEPKKRAPRTCSVCGSTDHTARTCKHRSSNDL